MLSLLASNDTPGRYVSCCGPLHSQGVCCRERANLAVQLKDTKSVVGRLKFVISIVLHCIFIFFYLVIYNVSRAPRTYHVIEHAA